ncbi:hypothetical protein [Kordiimonas sp.]|uniref:hypothetical protein n=1 Tax=Kordiimonas sp. TaxID=1970157 RepID=UPI003A91F5CD
MSIQSLVDIPPRCTEVFRGGIRHPALWLWDSWTAYDGVSLHLYSLALSRTAPDGTPIMPGDRNSFPFHVRHFVSHDDGLSWCDLGAVAKPGAVADGADERNVWSGSVLQAPDGRWLYGFTGLRAGTPETEFIQTIFVAEGDLSDAVGEWPNEALSCPVRDYEKIRAAGYFLGPKEELGWNTGEEGGPILAWRDPYLFYDANGVLNAVWAAKMGPAVPAVARAAIRKEDGRFILDRLYAPITLPDADQFTQAEVPKIYQDDASGVYYLLISACDRLYEGQPNAEVTMEMRLYKAKTLDGPWQPFHAAGSRLPELGDLFGASIISPARMDEKLIFLGPYTENAGPEKQLTFAAPVTVKQNT